MKKFVFVAIGAGLLSVAPTASAEPVEMEVSAEEAAWGDVNGPAICSQYAADSSPGGFEQLAMDVMDAGWDQYAAGRVIGYSLGTYCPAQLSTFFDMMSDLSQSQA